MFVDAIEILIFGVLGGCVGLTFCNVCLLYVDMNLIPEVANSSNRLEKETGLEP